MKPLSQLIALLILVVVLVGVVAGVVVLLQEAMLWLFF